jgi:hypothetical protein
VGGRLELSALCLRATARRRGTLECVIDPANLSDVELAELLMQLRAEQQDRAIKASDPEALIELGFREGFRSDGLPRDPWIVNGILVCPGARIDKSASSHDCGFARVDDKWVWEADGKIEDVVRNTMNRRAQMRSVTLVAIDDTTVVDLIYATCRTGAHKLKSARSFSVTAAGLVLDSERTPAPAFSAGR